MRLIDTAALNSYLRDDWVLRLLAEHRRPGDEALPTEEWLVGTPAKRLLFANLYQDLVEPKPERRVLDVGGGVSAATRALARASDYRVVDLLAHGGHQAAAELAREHDREIVIRSDWLQYAEASCDEYDVVIANDLFPNVDQRLDLFLSTFLPRTQQLRLSLTFYNTPRYYHCKRLDGDEIFCMLAWDGERTASALARHKNAIISPDFSVFGSNEPSLFTNGRLVCLATLRGSIG